MSTILDLVLFEKMFITIYLFIYQYLVKDFETKPFVNKVSKVMEGFY